jgi:endonuclease/exonuclease/phosphatase family metal-dependent hydrolase
MELNVLSFNIHKGLNATSSQWVLDKIQALLGTVDADIIFLQEVQGEHRQRQQKFASDWPDLSQTEFLAGKNWPYYCYGANVQHEYGHHGNAILSKYPLRQVQNLDISTGRMSQRGLLYAKVEIPQTTLSVHLLCTHLGLLKKERKYQFSQLNNFIQHTIPENETLIMAGDFNDWRSTSLKLLSKSLQITEVFKALKGAYARSCPAALPLLKVDRIYYRGLTPSGCEVVSIKDASDHLPLRASFTLN